MEPAQKKLTVVFFDFDGTLAKGDSLWPFLIAARGWRRCLVALGKALLAYVFMSRGRDRRTIVKERLLKEALGGARLKELRAAIEKMKSYPVWIDETVSALKRHHEAGHLVVIATGSLDLYMPALLKESLPYDELICTRMEVRGDALTGRMLDGNCVRLRKAELVADYIAKNGPFADSWAYGNLPHDLPMMELVKNRIVV